MISSIAWVPAGVAAPVPRKYEMSATEHELVRLMEEQSAIVGESADHKNINNSNTKRKQEQDSGIHVNLPADLRMDEYSSDDGDEDGGYAAGQLLVGMDDQGNIGEDADDGEKIDENSSNESEIQLAADDSHDTSDDDDDLKDVPDTREYMPVDVEGLASMGLSQIGGVGTGMVFDDDDADDDSYFEDVRLTEDDAIILVAKTEEDFASLEVHVYDRKSGNLYVHHDIPLPSFPLCVAHGQVSCDARSGNFCAVGTFGPGIEIWNLDIMNALEPSCILGGEDTSAADEIMKIKMLNGVHTSSSKSKLPANKRLRSGSHKDAVMALSWNSIHKQVIASGSADEAVKIWDVTKSLDGSSNAVTFRHHRNKVQSVVWHPEEGTLLATGSYDRSVAILDARSNGRDLKKVKIAADCEAMEWDPCHPEYLTVACEDGSLTCWDVRRFETSNPAWSTIVNEYGGITDISYNRHVPGMLALCSVDKTVSLWDTYGTDNDPKKVHTSHPRMCGSKDMGSGKLYTVSFYPSVPWLLGCGGSGNQLAIWDMSEESIIQNRFGMRVSATLKAKESYSKNAPNEEHLNAMMTNNQVMDNPTLSPGLKNNTKSKSKLSRRKGKRL